MMENKYDDPQFFEQYSKMSRSVQGLGGAGEWHELKKLLPDFAGKTVLDLGCGFGWHCRYAAEQGAESVTGVDLSEKMLKKAEEMTLSPNIRYVHSSIEEFPYPEDSFDVVISSLAFHYVESYAEVCRKIFNSIRENGSFVFSVEHPVFTAQGKQDWHYGPDGNPLYWPVDHYFTEGYRQAVFLGSEVVKYHRTLTTYLNVLTEIGFSLGRVVEPQPDPAMLDLPGMKDELRRPMMLIIQAQKPSPGPRRETSR